MLFCLLRSHRSQKNIEQAEKNKKPKRQKPCFPKEQVENADLYKPVLSQIMTTREYYIKQNFAALLMSKTKVPFPVLLNYVNGNKIHVKTQRKKDRLTKFLPYSVSTSEIVKDNHIIQL